MKLIVGLGNPGPKYAGNRHNAGWMAVERIAADHGLPPFRAKFQGRVTDGRLGEERVALLTPTTFMNESGRSVAEALRFHKLAPADLIVMHDELDLAPGRLKVKDGGGHAGHNGLRSIHAHVGPEYRRVRIGIGHPGHKDAVAGYVLRDFAKADGDWLDDLLRGVSDGAEALAAGDAGRFMNAVSLRVAPPRSGGGKGGGPGPAEGGGDGGRSAGRGGRGRADASGTEALDTEASGAEAPSAKAPTGEAAPDARSALRRLADRFR